MLLRRLDIAHPRQSILVRQLMTNTSTVCGLCDLYEGVCTELRTYGPVEGLSEALQPVSVRSLCRFDDCIVEFILKPLESIRRHTVAREPSKRFGPKKALTTSLQVPTGPVMCLCCVNTVHGVQSFLVRINQFANVDHLPREHLGRGWVRSRTIR
ncbi:Hypothetical protein PFR_JS17-2_1496 [Propionibacterium freudenreichii]|nr:Hypothetical protein PFR_JS17-1_1497 [Propionibacterium freudenreichii]SCQ79777.1 Hypothetical protein PFR_JS17-2_1496 [Propionibacterium freudenreichii]